MKNTSTRILFAVLMAVMMLITVVAATTEYPPIEIRFDGDEDATPVTYSSSYVNITEQNGYLHLEGTVGDNDNVNFVLNSEDYFDLYEYPYMRIKYKSTAANGYYQLYILANDNMFPETYTHRFRSERFHTALTQNEWQANIAPLNGVITTGIGPHGSSNSIPTEAGDNYVNALRLDLCRNSASGTTIDLEYIAFFHTEEEANAYGNTCNEYKDAVAGASFAYDSAEVADKEALTAAVQADIDAMEASLGLSYDVTATVSISDEQYAEVLENGYGTFGFDVAFATSKAVPRTYSYTASVVDTSAVGIATVTTPLTTMERGGAEVVLTAAVENIIGIQSYKWYMSTDDAADEADTLIEETTVNNVTFASPAENGDVYYYAVVVAANGNVTSEPIKITYVTPETVLWDMGDQTEVDNWNSNGIVKNDKGEIPVVADENGVTYAHMVRTGTTTANYSRTPTTQISIDNRPYIVERIRRNFTAAYHHYIATTYLDVNTHLQYAWYGGMLIPSSNSVYPGDGQWHNVVRHMPTDLTGYITDLKGTEGNVKGGVEWRSKIRNVMIQPASYTAGTYSDYEFIAFAATEELAYKVIADYAAKLAAKNADVSETVFASEGFTAKLEEIIKAAAENYGCTYSDIAVSDTTVAPTAGADGEYSFTFKISINGYTYSYEKKALLKGEGTDKPIIWRFNNEEAIADWNEGEREFNKNSSTLKNGVMHTVVSTSAAVSDHYLGSTYVGGNMPVDMQFYRQLYPYIKIKYRQGGFGTGKNIQLYLQSADYRMDLTKSTQPDVWVTAALDFSTNKGMSKGTYEDGLMNSISFWIWNSKTAESYDEIEYIAFFPSGEVGKAAWMNFDSKNPSETGSSDEYIDGYEEVNEVVTELETTFNGTDVYTDITDAAGAQALIEATVAEANSAVECTVSEGTQTKYGYSFDVTLTCGDDYRACTSQTITVIVKNKLSPIIWRFNNEEAIADWNKGRQYNSANTSVLKDGVMYTAVGATATVADHYLGATAVGGAVQEKFRFNREDYPYLKIKYRQGGFMSRGTVYFDNGDTYIALPSTPAANAWTTASYDLANATLNGSVKSYGTGPMKALGIWFWNNKTAGDSYDEIEYVAFFPAGAEGKAEWEAFDSANPTVAGSSDAYIEGYEGIAAVIEALDTYYGEDAYPTVGTVEEARAMIEATIIEALGTSGVKYVLSEGSEASNGYDFDLTLTYGENYMACQHKELTVTLMTSGGKQPLIWRFNTAEAVADWQTGKSFNKDAEGNVVNGTIVDNVLKTPIAFVSGTTGLVSDHYLGTSGTGAVMPDTLNFNREDYPYFKVKYRHNGFMTNGQIYIGSSSNRYEFSVPAANTWSTLAVDFSTATFKAGSFGTGPINMFAFWLWNGDSSLTGYDEIEYIAFFPKGNAGRLAWEAFDSETPHLTASSDAYLDGYDMVEPIITALDEIAKNVDTTITDADKAKALVSDAVAEAAGENPVTYTIGDAVANDEGYTVTVTLTAGTNLKARVVRTTDVVIKNEYPDPIIWKFNNPEFVSKWVGTGNCPTSFVHDTDGIYLRAAMTEPKDNCNITWSNIPEENRFDATDYPYIAIRYKSSRAGNIQLYPATSISTNTGASGSFYYQLAMPAHTGDWQTKVWNIKTDCTMKNNSVGTWDGEVKYLRVDFMRSAAELKWINVDYIAFFATKEQADEFVAAPYVYGNQTTVDEFADGVDMSSLEVINEAVNDEATAKAKVEELIASIELPEGVKILQNIAGYSAGDAEAKDGMAGSYTATIYFVNGPLGASAVAHKSVTMPLAPKAVIQTLGAQIRTPGENQGLRFGARLAKNIFGDPDIENISYGTVVLPEDLMPEDEMLTLDTIATDPAVKIADVKGELIYSEDDTSLIYTAVITDIDPDDAEACARKFVTRPYVKYTFNGKDYIIYSPIEKTRSVDDVEGLMMEGYDTVVPLGAVPYDRETWMVPFWKGNTVYHELFWPVMPEGAAETDELEVTLLYPITEVLSLKDGKNMVDYVEGKDFFIRDGKLVIPADSAIERTAFNFYIADNNDDELHGQTVSVPDANSADYKYHGKKLFYKEGTYIQENFQYSISYLHSETWPETALNPHAIYEENTLTATRQKLANKENLVIGYYGDSITAGGNNTGNYGVHPNTPKWDAMIVQSLNELYGYDAENPGVTLVNKARGGRNTNWGVNGETEDVYIENGYAKYAFENNIPDLFVLAFGMNDEGTGIAKFKSNLINIIDQIRELNPDCEFILVSNSMPNPLWGSTANRTQYEGICEEIVSELRVRSEEDGGPVVIDCARLQGMHKQFLTVKPYRDMTGNNVNHQNDMLARLYAQTVLACITDLYE